MAHYRRFRPWMLNGHPGNISLACKRYIVRAYNAGLVVTATTDGKHAPGSYHYPRFRGGKGRAVDVGLRGPEIGTEKGRERMERFQSAEARRPIRYYELIGPRDELCVAAGHRYVIVHGSFLEREHESHVHAAPRW